MLNKIIALYEAYAKDENGATAIEYGLIAAGISLAIVAGAFAFGNQLEETFNTMTTEMESANDNLG